MNTTAVRSRAGFAYYEIVVAILLLAIAVHPLVSTLSANTHMSTDRRERLAAGRIMRNETALLSSADPALVEPLRTYTVDAGGRPDPQGHFTVTSTKTVRCGLGGATSDNLAEAPPLGCASGGAVAEYRLSVTYPRPAGSDDAGTLTQVLAVAATTANLGTPIGVAP